MTFLPMVERELRVAARLTATYRNRAIVAGVVAMVAMVMFAFGAFSDSPSRIGRSLFWTVAYPTLVFCLLEGVRKTASCLSEEKREGTLGLLFLTDLKGYDIILGKMAAKSLPSIYALFSVMPIMGLGLLLGGVTGAEYWRTAFALLNCLLFSLSVGMFVSCWHHDDQKAMTTTLLVVALWTILPLFAPNPYSNFSPIHAFNAADAGVYLRAPGGYWQSLAITQGLSWLLLLGASLAVPVCWREEKLFRLFSREPRRNSFTRQPSASERAQKLDINPALWLASRNVPGRFWLFIMALLVVLFIPVLAAKPDWFISYIVTCCVLNFALKLRVAAQACSCLAEARRNNAIEMLLVTPLTVEQIIYGQIAALKKIYSLPIILILTLEFIGLLSGAAFFTVSQHESGIFIVGSGLAACGYLALFALDICAVAWAGMWHGLSCRTEGQAVTRTILLVLVLPLCCMLFLCYGIPFFIGLPIMFMVNSSGNLRRKFRELAGQRFTAPPESGWIPGAVAQSPPVIRVGS